MRNLLKRFGTLILCFSVVMGDTSMTAFAVEEQEALETIDDFEELDDDVFDEDEIDAFSDAELEFEENYEDDFYTQTNSVNYAAADLIAEPIDGATYSLKYEIINGEVTITGFTGTASGDLIIPGEIDGYPVTVIGCRAFGYTSSMKFTGKLVIPDTVTNIEANAFCGCKGLIGDLVIPDSVITIGDQAFAGCRGFTGNLLIGDSVTCIEDDAFVNCDGFAGELVIGKSVTTIGDYAFKGCKGFTGDLVISDSVISIGNSTFYNCSGFTGELVIGNSVATIGGHAFYNCSGFTGDLIIPDSVTTIEGMAFYECSGFTGNLIIGDSVTDIKNMTFSGCSGFAGDLIIGDSVATLSRAAFSGSKNFTGDLIIGDALKEIENTTFCQFAFTGKLVIGKSVEKIGVRAFERCSGFAGELIVPDSVTTIEDDAFYGCSGFTGDLIIPDSVITIGWGAFGECSGFSGDLVIGDSVTNIERQAFYECSGFTGALVLGNSVEIIGPSAFAGCSGLTGRLIIPESVITIEEYAFYRCNGFTGKVVIPNSVKEIEGDAFCSQSLNTPAEERNPNLYEFFIPASVEKVSLFSFTGGCPFKKYIFHCVPGSYAYEALCKYKDVNVVPWDGITDPEPFSLTYRVVDGKAIITGYEGTARGNLNIPSEIDGYTVIGIDDNAFIGATGFTGRILLADTITQIGNCAFENCDKVKGKLVLPESLETIGEAAFRGCSGLSGNLTIPGLVTTIEESTFEDCSKIESIFWGKAITDIGDNAFCGCTNLKNIYSYIPFNHKVNLGENVFHNCGSELLSGNTTIVEYNNPWLEEYVKSEYSGSVITDNKVDKYSRFVREYNNSLGVPLITGIVNGKWYFTPDSDDTYGYYISSRDLEKLKKQLSPVDKKLVLYPAAEALSEDNVWGDCAYNVDGGRGQTGHITWNGSCFGYSTMCALLVNGNFDNICADGTGMMSGLNRKIAQAYGDYSRIHYYHFQQYSSHNTAKTVLELRSNLNPLNPFGTGWVIDTMCEAGEKASDSGEIGVLTFMRLNDGASHAVNICGMYELTADITLDNQTVIKKDDYSKCILIHDSNHPDKTGITNPSNIFISRDENNWYLPGWDIDKYTGRILAVSQKKSDIDIYSYNGQANKASIGDQVAFIRYSSEMPLQANSMARGATDNLVVYTVPDSNVVTAALTEDVNKASFSTEKMAFSFYTDNHLYQVNANEGGTVQIDRNKSLVMDAKQEGDFSVMVTSDESDMAGDVHNALLSVNNTGNLEIQSVEDGILVSGDDLSDIHITEYKDDESENEASCSSDENTLLISFEDGDESISVKADKDGDGIFDDIIEVEPEYPDGLWIDNLDDGGYAYTGSAIKPVVKVYDGSELLVAGKDYTIAYKNNTNYYELSEGDDGFAIAKAPTITVTGKGNYAGKETATFKINRANIADSAFAADDIVLKTTGRDQKPKPVFTWNGKNVVATGYSYQYFKADEAFNPVGEAVTAVKDAGNYVIVISGKNNFTGTRNVKLKLTSDLKLLSGVAITKIPNQPYTGGAITPTLTVKDGKTPLVEGVDYTVEYKNNVAVGNNTATATITGIGNYIGTKKVSFTITGTALSKATVMGITTSVPYTGNDITFDDIDLFIKATRTTEQMDLEEGSDYTVSYQNNQKVGTATVIFTGINGYTGTVKKTFRITALKSNDILDRIAIELVGGNEVTYSKGGAKPFVKVTFTNGDETERVLAEKTDYTVSYSNNTAVNDGSNPKKLPTVKITLKGNITGSLQENYTIVAKDISTVKAEATDKVYQPRKNAYATTLNLYDVDGKKLVSNTDYNKELIYTYKEATEVINNGISVERLADSLVEKDDILPAGTAVIITANAKANSNYVGTISTEYRISKSSISSATIKIPDQIYTGKVIEPTAEEMAVTVAKQPLTAGEDFEVVPGSYVNNVKTGNASVTIKGKGNYIGTKKVNFKIKQKAFVWWWNR